jgi:hypothetical protein
MKNIRFLTFISFLFAAVFLFSGCELLLNILGDIGSVGNAPSVPQNLSASFNTRTNEVELTWQNVTDASYYNVFFSDQNSTKTAEYLNATSNNYYYFKPPVSNTTLYFWIQAVNSYGNSSASNCASVNINIKIPLIFDVMSAGEDFISIAFSEVNNVYRYYLMLGTNETNLYREKTFTDEDFDAEKHIAVYKIDNLQSGTKYYMQIKIDDNNTTEIINHTTNKPYEFFVSEPIYYNDSSYSINGVQGRKILYTRINTSDTSTVSKSNGTSVASVNSFNASVVSSSAPVLSSIKEQIDEEVNAILKEKNITYPEEFLPARIPINELIKNDPKVSRPVTSRANVGNSSSFWIETAKGIKKTRTATVRATGKYCEVYVDDDVYSSTSVSDKDNKITTIQAQAIRDKFDSLYLKMTNIFGELYSEKISGFIAPQSKIKIYIYDIYEDYSQNQTGGIYGYFWSKDLYPQSTISYSNECPMFYIDSFFLDSDTNTMYSTLFHEFQHMLRFMNKNMPLGTTPDADGTWANEMMSMLAEEILQQDLGIEDEHSPKSRLNTFLNGGYMLSGLNTWLSSDTNNSDVLYSYANAYAFGTFLMRNYGGLSLVQEMSANNKYNLEQITSAVRAMGYFASYITDKEIINTLLLEFSRSLFYTDFAGTTSVSNSPKIWNKSFSQTLGSYTYSITPILLSDYYTVSGSSVYAGAIGYSNTASALQTLSPYTFQLHVWGEATDNATTVRFTSQGTRNQNEVLYIIVK